MDHNATRYSRQHLFRPIGLDGQRKLAQSRVAIIGAGALGTVLANHLVRAGVGYVRIIDRDIVEWSNLQRQMLYDEEDASEARPKALAAAAHLRAINHSVIIDPHVVDIVARNAEQLLHDVDVIVDGSDNFAVRFLVNDVAIKNAIPWVYGGAVASRGMVYPILPGETPCLHCLFPDVSQTGRGETCDTIGVIGPVVDVVASMQATIALQLLVGAKVAMQSRMVHLDLWTGDWHTISMGSPRQDCPTCKTREFPFLSDTRSPETVSLCGRDTIQITPNIQHQVVLSDLAQSLQPLGSVQQTKFFVRARIEQYQLTVFSDGRALIQGTDDPAIAKSVYAKYVGA